MFTSNLPLPARKRNSFGSFSNRYGKTHRIGEMFLIPPNESLYATGVVGANLAVVHKLNPSQVERWLKATLD